MSKQILDLEATRDVFHLAVLEAIDKAAAQTFKAGLGSIDDDLHSIFKAIDAHIVVLAERLGVTLVSPIAAE